MSRTQEYRVVDPDGATGILSASSRFLDDNPNRLIRLDDGREIVVPKELLRPQDDGSFRLTARVRDILSSESQPGTVDTGRIRVNKRVETTESLVDEPLLRESYDIQRMSVNRIVEEAPKPHYEGDTLVLPILEEVLVVEKRLILREEVRVTPKREEVHDPQTHTLRREQVEVERV